MSIVKWIDVEWNVKWVRWTVHDVDRCKESEEVNCEEHELVIYNECEDDWYCETRQRELDVKWVRVADVQSDRRTDANVDRFRVRLTDVGRV